MNFDREEKNAVAFIRHEELQRKKSSSLFIFLKIEYQTACSSGVFIEFFLPFSF